MANFDIEISEVGPRDGLQSIKAIMPTEAKKAWIKAEFEAGVPEIEVGSFVSPKLLPQLADTAEIVAYARTLPGLQIAALVPNLRGLEAAVKAGVHKVGIPFSQSETHSIKNVKKTHPEMLAEIQRCVEFLQTVPAEQRPRFEVGLSTAFGCTIEGNVDEDVVVSNAEKVLEIGADEVGLSDTTGFANPVQLKRITQRIWDSCGKDKLMGVHLHNTRGQGLANVLAAVEMGITTVDASLGGIGGCPWAPGASGNIVTEDLVWMLEAMGLKTGIDIDKLLAVRELVKEALPDEPMYGFIPDAGVPKGFVPASAV
ncbi:hydroxymethylglutaryl-CoA lyase [Oceanicoccus sagamiensis]|uniref:Hydroxymethylglutaryl-CoA lyase n=1 Tax=Oceanicoccus sagamiensis TaxID=716816 RepID=A0A1X9N6M8_9GAMM|nr:hydroxymethylglutaryl-CoA lyase [Oceanicoccus sagamiensis]ARN73356.1 hydroxymethylglutaryl-CoA lyase [Oceanicoccus sagamiensis]